MVSASPLPHTVKEKNNNNNKKVWSQRLQNSNLAVELQKTVPSHTPISCQSVANVAYFGSQCKHRPGYRQRFGQFILKRRGDSWLWLLVWLRAQTSRSEWLVTNHRTWQWEQRVLMTELGREGQTRRSREETKAGQVLAKNGQTCEVDLMQQQDNIRMLTNKQETQGWGVKRENMQGSKA